MSGRIYNPAKGIPICDFCGEVALTCQETNHNGEYCPNCRKHVLGWVTYNINHPIWIAWQEYQKSKQGIFEDFTYGLKEFKKDHGFTT